MSSPIRNMKIYKSALRLMTLSLAIVASMVFMPESLQATHIIGGDLSYRAVGGDGYELTLRIRRDCENGAEEADFDDPAVIGIFDKDGNWLFNYGFGGQFLLEFQGSERIEDELASECFEQQGALCVDEAVYVDTVWLPIQDEGYILAYQRCCRNVILDNIVDPLNTGVIYKTCIEPEAMDGANKSAQFKDHTPLYLCVNEAWTFDHGATDEDGDDLVYSLYTPFQSGSAADPIILPPFGQPLDREVDWVSPTYSETNQLGGSNPLTINASTGIITAIPEITGVFLIGVKVEEFRNGELINTVYRDMEVDVRACGDVPTADFTVEEFNCDGFDVEFTNNSSDANSYTWFFDFPDSSFTSDLENPGTITYPGPGAYTVVLRAFADDGCFAEAVQTIFVNDFNGIPDFISDVESCDEDIVVTLTDDSDDPDGSISDYLWTIEGADTTVTGSGTPFTFVLSETGVYSVTLDITDSIGCQQSITKEITYNRLGFEFNFEDGADSVRACFGDPTQILLNGDPNFTYTWSPEDGLDDPTSSNPLATPDESTTYSVTVTDGMCEVTGEVDVLVIREEASIDGEISEIDCDGNATLISSNSIDADVEWSTDPEFGDIISTETSIDVTVDEIETFYVRIVEGIFECIEVVDTIVVENPDIEPEIDIDVDESGPVGGGSGDTPDDRATVCLGQPLVLDLGGDLSGEDLTIVWSPEDCIISGQGTESIVVDTDNADCTDFTVTVTNEFGCEGTTEFFVEYEETPDLEIIAADYQQCGLGNVSFMLDNPDDVDIMWDFGNGDMSTEDNPDYVYDESGIYTVVVSSKGLCIASDTIMVDVFVFQDNGDGIGNGDGGDGDVIPDTIAICNMMPVILNDGGDATLDYTWSPADIFDDVNATSPEIDPSEDVLITVMVTDPNNPFCTLFDTAQVIVADSIGLSVTPDVSLCQPDSVTLSASTTRDDVSIVWLDENGNEVGTGNDLEIFADESTCYTAVATDAAGCEESEEVCIDVVPEFSYEIEVFDMEGDGNDGFCAGEEGVIVITDTDEERDFTYTWGPDGDIDSGADTDMAEISPDETTTYNVTITDEESGCEVVDQVTVPVLDPSCSLTADMDTVIQGNGGTSIDSDCGDNDDLMYEWTDENGNVIGDGPSLDVDPMETTTYTLTTTDENGCTSVSMITITVLTGNCDESDIFVPNAFTPNGDGLNDIWLIRSVFIDEFTVVVYNRWGEQVFQSDDILIGWDGIFEGEEAKPDVYGYHLTATCFNGETYTERGNVTLLR